MSDLYTELSEKTGIPRNEIKELCYAFMYSPRVIKYLSEVVKPQITLPVTDLLNQINEEENK